MVRKRPMVRTVTPPIIARWLEVKHLTVLNWIRKRSLPALNISGSGRTARYIVFRKDLATFLLARGMSEERVREILGGN